MTLLAIVTTSSTLPALTSEQIQMLGDPDFLQAVKEQILPQAQSSFPQSMPNFSFNSGRNNQNFGDRMDQYLEGLKNSDIAKEFRSGLRDLGGTVKDGLKDAFGTLKKKTWGEICISSAKTILPVVALIVAVALTGIAINQLKERIGKPALMINPGKKTKDFQTPVFEGDVKKQLDSYVARARAAIIHNRKSGKKIEIQPLILYGPGGTGKTMFAQYIAKALGNAPFNMLTGGSFKNFARRGEHINEARKLFKYIARRQGRVYLFDEITSLASANPDDVATQEVLDEVKAWTGGNALSKNIIIFTTNTLKIDPAFITRCKVIYIGLPNDESRKKILIDNLLEKNLLGNEQFCESTIKKIVEQTKGWCGRTINFFVNESLGESVLYEKEYSESHILDLLETYNKNLSQLQLDGKDFAETGELAARIAT